MSIFFAAACVPHSDYSNIRLSRDCQMRFLDNLLSACAPCLLQAATQYNQQLRFRGPCICFVQWGCGTCQCLVCLASPSTSTHAASTTICLLLFLRIVLLDCASVDDEHNIVGMITRKDIVSPALKEALANLNQAAAMVNNGARNDSAGARLQ